MSGAPVTAHANDAVHPRRAREGEAVPVRASATRSAMHALAALACLAVLGCVGGCATSPSAEEADAARNTFGCQLEGERLVVRFETDEARMLMPGGERVTLYRLPAASGVRYSNGTLELRGKGTDLELLRNGERRPLAGCAPYTLPK